MLSCKAGLRPVLLHKGRTLASGETDRGVGPSPPFPSLEVHSEPVTVHSPCPVPFHLPSTHPILSSFPCVTGAGLYFFIIRKMSKVSSHWFAQKDTTRLWGQNFEVWQPELGHCCVTLGKSLYFSEPHWAFLRSLLSNCCQDLMNKCLCGTWNSPVHLG